jgi:hypothetical protein
LAAKLRNVFQSLIKKIGEYSRINHIIGRTRKKWRYRQDISQQGLVSKEKLAINYLFLDFPRQELLITATFLLGPVLYFFNSYDQLSSNSINFQEIEDVQFEFLDNYLLWAKIPLVIILSYLVTYQWAIIKKNGSFGYWLSLGVNRSYFFTQSLKTFSFNVFLGNLLGFLIILYPGGLSLSFSEILILLLLIFSSNFLLIGFALLFAEIIRIPEFASLLFMTLMGLNLAFNRNNNNLLSMIFLSEFQFINGSILISLLLSFLIGVTSVIGALKLHQRKDIEI